MLAQDEDVTRPLGRPALFRDVRDERRRCQVCGGPALVAVVATYTPHYAVGAFCAEHLDRRSGE